MNIYTMLNMQNSTPEYYYTDDKNQVVGPLNIVQIKQLHKQGQLFNDTQVCKKGETKWIPLGKELTVLAHSKRKEQAKKTNKTSASATVKHKHEALESDKHESLSVPEILNLSNLPATCRLIRIVCKFVICSHVIALLSGIGAGIGGLFKHANPALGALIGLVLGSVISYFVLTKIEN